jgi:oligopeptide/dipeptide ABC transporter ATP-binding protein
MDVTNSLAPAAVADAARTAEPLLAVEHLALSIDVRGVPRPILRDVTLSVAAGEALGIVGESGSGKSMTTRVIDRLLPPGAHASGSVHFEGRDVLTFGGAELAAYRGDVAMIFQDPRAHINPLRTVGQFLVEALATNRRVPEATAAAKARALLGEVGVDRPETRMRQLPGELSGGLLQRVMIASALLTEPKLLLADEPTTAIDVTTQSEVMAIIDELRRERHMAMVFITHDLELAAAVCDRTAVMYAGSIVEDNVSASLHDRPRHPYTAALGEARPSLTVRAGRLRVIPGRPISAAEAAPDGCAFAPRCSMTTSGCLAGTLELVPVDAGHARCLHSDELARTWGRDDA